MFVVGLDFLNQFDVSFSFFPDYDCGDKSETKEKK